MQLPEPAREARVIVPVYRAQDGALHLLLLRRSSRGIHGGQIALPGGKREPGDASILHTALRETHEEIGIAAECIRMLASRRGSRRDLPCAGRRTRKTGSARPRPPGVSHMAGTARSAIHSPWRSSHLGPNLSHPSSADPASAGRRMGPMNKPPVIRALSRAEMHDLEHAKSLLEHPGFAMRLTELIGSPIEKGFALLPRGWNEAVNKATRAALLRALQVAIATLRSE